MEKNFLREKDQRPLEGWLVMTYRVRRERVPAVHFTLRNPSVVAHVLKTSTGEMEAGTSSAPDPIPKTKLDKQPDSTGKQILPGSLRAYSRVLRLMGAAPHNLAQSSPFWLLTCLFRFQS